MTKAVNAIRRIRCSLLPALLLAASVSLADLLSTGDMLPVADRVVVDKSERRLYLIREEEVLASFEIALGQEPIGHKSEEGDSRTPEGRYFLDARNRHSDFFLSIHISYPNPSDRREAASRGVSPGGQIMIHGQPNEPKYSREFYRSADWTDGCIAVSNAAMVDIWLMTDHNTPIEIRP